MNVSPVPEHQVYTVSQLNREARSLLESSFPSIRLEGEISNLARPASGHVYFSLKDAKAQTGLSFLSSAFIFRSAL